MVPAECIAKMMEADSACREASRRLQELGVGNGEIKGMTGLAPYLIVVEPVGKIDKNRPDVYFCVPAGQVPESVRGTVSGYPPIAWYRVVRHKGTFLFVSSRVLGRNLELVKMVQDGEAGETLLPATDEPVRIDLGKKQERQPETGTALVPVPGGNVRVEVRRYHPSNLAVMVEDAWKIAGYEGNETPPSEMYLG